MNRGETPAPGEDSPRPGRTTLLEELLELGLKTDYLDFQLIVLTLLAGIVALFGLLLSQVKLAAAYPAAIWGYSNQNKMFTRRFLS